MTFDDVYVEFQYRSGKTESCWRSSLVSKRYRVRFQLSLPIQK